MGFWRGWFGEELWLRGDEIWCCVRVCCFLFVKEFEVNVLCGGFIFLE